MDSGQFTLHLRAPTGTRIEETARLCDQVEKTIREEIPPEELASIIDNIGLPYSSVNLSYSNSAPIGTGDADILVSLTHEHHPTAEYVRKLRLRLAREYPGVTFYVLASDMVSQILNFGLPAPINVQVVGQQLVANRRFAEDLLGKNQATFRARWTCTFRNPSTCPGCRSTSIAPARRRWGSRRAMWPAIC